MTSLNHNHNAPLDFVKALSKSSNAESAFLDEFVIDSDELDLAHESIHHDLQHIMDESDIWNEVEHIDSILNIREG